MRRRLAAAAALTGGLLASACALPPPRLDVEQQWRESINNLGMFAIYPPSEDVFVGDTFLYVPNAVGFDLVRITAAPRTSLAEQFRWQEEDRPALDTSPRQAVPAAEGRPARAADSGGAPGFVVCPASSMSCIPPRNLRRVAPYDLVPGAEHLTRLREAAIPTLEVGRFSQGEVAGGIMSGNLGLGLGLGSSAASALRVELRGLQTAMLDELRASRLVEQVQIERVRRIRGREGDFPNSLTPLMLARSLMHADNRNGKTMSQQFCRGDFASLDGSGARLVIANKVLYANGVTFDYLNESVFAARGSLDFVSALENAIQAPQVRSLPDMTPSTAQAATRVQPTTPSSGPTVGTAPLQTEIARLLRIQNDILTLPVGGPGQASARLTVGRFGTLAMEREFARPAAVGMGAALQFPIGEAAVPVTDDQIDDVLLFCQVLHGLDAAATMTLRRRLQASKAWVEYLEARGGGAGARDAASRARLVVEDPEVERAMEVRAPLRHTARTALPPLVPSASIRVRL